MNDENTTPPDDGFEQLSFFAVTPPTEPAQPEKIEISPAARAENAELETVAEKIAVKPLEPVENIQAAPADSPPEAKKTKRKSKESKPQTDGSEKTDMNITEPELKIDFEASLAQLETVVKELDGEVKLEKALQLFEQGIKLSVECEQFIKGAEAKIEILKKQADGSLVTEIFKGERVDLDD